MWLKIVNMKDRDRTYGNECRQGLRGCCSLTARQRQVQRRKKEHYKTQ